MSVLKLAANSILPEAAEFGHLETSNNLPLRLFSCFYPAGVICRELMMRGQPGFGNLNERYERLSAVGDLWRSSTASFLGAVFEKPLAKALKRSDGSKG